MTNPLLRHITYEQDGAVRDGYYWWCPGCARWANEHVDTGGHPGNGTHLFHIPPWTFDGNMESPTFEASYLSYGVEPKNGYAGAPRCHSFVRAGMIQYLGDSEHPLAGQTVPMAPLPDWLNR